MSILMPLLEAGASNLVILYKSSNKIEFKFKFIEDVVLIFKFFFDGLYNFVVGGILPQKPKPFRCSLCITAAFLGWVLIRDKVLPKFGLCKSHEFTSVLYLLDHVVPLVFFHYHADFQKWQHGWISMSNGSDGYLIYFLAKTALKQVNFIIP